MFLFLLHSLSWGQDYLDISGKWVLNRRENLENYLNSRGETNPIKQSAIKCIKPIVDIKQNEKQFEITTTLTPCIPLAPSKTIHRKFVADGKTPSKGELLKGQNISWVAWLKQNELFVEAQTPNGKEYVTRQIIDGVLIQKNWLADKKVVLTQYYTKINN